MQTAPIRQENFGENLVPALPERSPNNEGYLSNTIQNCYRS